MLKKIFLKINNGFINDALLNIFATAILTFTSQLIVYPFLSRNLTSIDYGELLTIIGIINTLSVSFGNTLNISRLLTEPKFKELNKSGDYNLIFFRVQVLISIVLYIIFLIFFDFSSSFIIQLIILSSLITFRSFYVVDFRLILNYKKLIKLNFFGGVGYLFSLLIFDHLPNWIFVFIIGELFSCIFLVFQSFTLKEKFIRTELYSEIIKQYNTLLLSAFISNSSQYLDRFLINPVLGSAEVSIYTVASFLGKSLNIVISPINSVILAHSINERSINVKKLNKRLLNYFIVYLIIFISILLIGPLTLKVLYPTIAEFTKPYFAIANLSTLVMGYGGTMMQLLLRYSEPRWQLFINVSYILLYLVLSIIGLYFGQLLGFSIAVLVANTSRVIIMYFILIRSIKKKQTL